MSKGHVLVSGKKLANTPAGLKYIDELDTGTNFEKGEFVYPTVESLLEDIEESEKGKFENLESILVMDYGFEDVTDVDLCIEEFLSLHNELIQKELSNIKLNLLTKNVKLYEELEHRFSESGEERVGVLYAYSYTMSIISLVLSGEHYEMEAQLDKK